MGAKILIAAQYYRVGSTLIQRCLHQCENTKIYGEMNNLLDAAQMVERMGQPGKTMCSTEESDKKKENWENKIDDDYSLCIPKEKLRGLGNTILFYALGIKPEAEENFGFKCISPTANSLIMAANLGFKIVWVTRDIKDALNSYLSQPWNHGAEAFMACKSRSDTVTEEFWKYLSSKENPAEVYKIDYSEIHEKIGGVIDAMGLKIEKEKLDSILANKVNSGY